MRVAHGLLVSVAAFYVSCGAAFGADPTSLASHSQSVNTVRNIGETRLLRSHQATADDKERGLLDFLKKQKDLLDGITEKRLNKMLISEETAEKNFVRWNSAIKKDGEMAAKIEQAVMAKGEHYGTLLTQFHIHSKRK